MAIAVRLLLAVTLAAGLASCGGYDSSSPPRLDPAVASRLASASDDVAAALDAGRCPGGSLRELQRGAGDGGLPAAVRRELRRVLDRADVRCPRAAPQPAPVTTVAPDGGDEDEGHGGGRRKEKKAKKDKNDKKDKKHGHGHGGGDD